MLGLVKEIEVSGKQRTVVKLSTEPLVPDLERHTASHVLTEQENAKVAAMLAASDYLAVDTMNDGEYCVRIKNRLLGGGNIGAMIGMVLGKFSVQFVGYGSILLVSKGVTLVAGPVVGGAAGTAMYNTAGPFIEAWSVKAAIAGGIAGGVATGPV